MTSGETEETCGGQEQGGRGGGGGSMKLSVTALSTIAIQAGQSLMVVSVLKSGSLVHLQLVQVHPALCEIGSSHEETQTLIQEQQQLMDKLKKHEDEVLSVVEKNQQTEERRRRRSIEGLMKRNKKQEEEEAVHRGMVASVKEGWSLLLGLLQRRQEVLTLAADFHRRALEFGVSIDRVEALQIGPDDNNDRLTELQLTYDSMRKDLLGKSLQVLSSSSVLLHKLRQLQRTEALQRRGGVLQEEEEEESSQCSRGVVLRLEQLVESLQDRRRRVDQAVRLQFQQVENCTVKEPQESTSVADWSLFINESRSTSAESVDLRSESRSAESLDLRSESRSEESLDLRSESRSEETRDLKPESRSEETNNLKLKPRSEETKDLKPEFRADLKPESRSEETRSLTSESRSEETKDIKTESRSEETKDLKTESRSEVTRDLKLESRSDLQPESRSEETKDLKPESRSEETKDLKLESRSEETRDLKLESRSEETKDLKLELRSEETKDLKLESRSEETRDLKLELRSEETRDVRPKSRSDLKSKSKPEETRDIQSQPKLDQMPGSRSDLKPGFRLDVKPKSRTEPARDMAPGSRSEESRNIESGCRLHLKPEFKSDLKPRSRSEDPRDLKPESKSDLQPGFRLEFKPESRTTENRNQMSGSRSEESRNIKSGYILPLKPESRSDDTRDLKTESTSELKPEFRPVENRNQMSGSRSEESRNIGIGCRLQLKPESRSEDTIDLKPEEARSELKPESRPTENREQMSESRSDLKSDSKQEETGDLQPESRSKETVESGFKSESSAQVAELRTQSEEDHAHQTLLINQKLRLLSSCEQLLDKVCNWVQQSSSVLSNSCEAGRQLPEAEDTLNTHLQLRTQAESAGHDAENLKQILDQVRALHTSRQLSPLKALTEQLKRGSMDRRTRTGAALPGPSLSPELAGRVDVVLKDLQSLNKKIDSNLELLEPYVTFLRTARQVEEELEELREIYSRRPEEEDEEVGSSRFSVVKKKKQVDPCWQEMLQRFLTCQELGNNYIHTATKVSGAALNLQSLVSEVQHSLECLSRTKQEVNELRSQQQIQIQQQQEYCRKYWERLHKTLQDLNCVSEMLDSCTLMDLGSDLQTSRLQQHFSQARPHFTQLDAEVEFMVKSWETVRGVQERLEVEELKGGAVREEDLSELLKLQERVKNTIHQSESILDLTSSFHLTSKQLEALLQSDPRSPLTGSTGSSDSEQIQSLFKTASALKTEICTAVNHTGGTCFRVQQLEARLLSLDSLCVSWQNEAARREEKLRRELLTRLLNQDINQLRDSFKELKKRFSNLRYNYLKRNDRIRNTKAVRNQLQQVELYEEKLQALRKRLLGVTARLGSEVKEGGVAREAEDAVNELQRQMGEFERSFSEHQKTLEMTCKLQQAMEEYQFWCEDASATIARVGKFSSECRSTEAVSVLYRQFEKFVWPTVPQQEERISQITELAVRLHGAEEGRRFIEKTVSKHSEMVEAIRELSDGLMKLEAKLKLESVKQQQDDGEKEMNEEKETEEEEKDEEKEKKWKENRKLKKEQTDNRSTQEANDVYELKETGHTPELTTMHDGKEVPVKRQTAANRKPPLQKSRSQDADSRPPSSYCSTHTFSLSCSPAENNRRVHAIHGQSQAAITQRQATPPPALIGPLFSDIQREFQRKEISNMTPLQDASAGGLSETDLQQQEEMTEDSLSNDEYDCASPDDISLPPLAETPESNMVQSDVEEGFCFSSHSVHIHQYSRQSEHSGAGIGTGAAPQQKESIQNESCPTPPTSSHSSTRFRSESSSFVQSPSTVPAPSVLTSTLCSILKTGKTSTANVPQSADLSLGAPEQSFPSGSNPVHKRKTPDNCSNKEINVPEKTSPLKTENNQPQRSIGILGKTTQNQNVESKEETLPQTDPIPQVAELNQHTTIPQSIYCPQPFTVPDSDLHRDKTPPQDTKFLKYSTTFPQTRTSICQENSFPQSIPDPESDLHQDQKSSQTQKDTSSVSKLQKDNSPTSTTASTITQQTIHFQSSLSDSHRTLPQASSSPLSKTKTLPRVDPVPQARGFSQSLKSCGATSLQTTTTLSQDGNISQSHTDSRSGLDKDVPSPQTSKKTLSVMPQSSFNIATSVTQQTVYCQSPLSDSHRTLPQASSSPLSQSKTLPQVDPVPQARGFSQSLTDSVLHENKTQDTGLLKSFGSTSLQTTTTLSEDSNISQSHPESRSGLDKDAPSPQTSKETSLVSMPQSSFTTATTVTQQTVYCQSSPSDSHFNVPQASSNLRSQQEHPSGSGGLPEVNAPIPPEPNSVSSISISSTITSSNRFSSKQSHQTVYSFHDSLTSTCTQQCVHDPGMTPGSTAKPAAPPQPEPHTQALAQQANPHVTLSFPPHLLTPDQDPNICQPVAIREEIMLTPQIQGPSLPAPPPPPQVQAESLPQGKASKPGPPCFTRPLSRATVMEGSPVTLEVEVTGQPEPSLTWCTDGEPGLGQAPPSCEDGKHFLLTPETSDSDVVLYEARAAEHPNSSGGDKWLVEEVFDIISVDVQTWFGTLCVLLWLLYLILL